MLIDFTGYGGRVIATTTDGRLKSPNFPRNYPNNLEYMWTITNGGEEGQRLEIEFSFIKIEKKYDTLKICKETSCNSQNIIAILTGMYCYHVQNILGWYSLFACLQLLYTD